MHIQEALEEDIWIIQLLAKRTWPHAFAQILTEEQIEYMMDMMYSTEAIKQQMSDGHHYLLANDKGEYMGYLSYQLNYKIKDRTKIHKIYVLPNTQGKGIGRFMIDALTEKARQALQAKLSLNVNRYNHAIDFYKHLEFVIVAEENIDIGNGFLMEDYVMERAI